MLSSPFMLCTECKRHYPTELMIARICPLCGLRWRNHIHGLPEDTPFHGQIAAQLHAAALEFDRSREKKAKGRDA